MKNSAQILEILDSLNYYKITLNSISFYFVFPSKNFIFAQNLYSCGTDS